jgi:hypothetical protein
VQPVRRLHPRPGQLITAVGQQPQHRQVLVRDDLPLPVPRPTPHRPPPRRPQSQHGSVSAADGPSRRLGLGRADSDRPGWLRPMPAGHAGRMRQAPAESPAATADRHPDRRRLAPAAVRAPPPGRQRPGWPPCRALYGRSTRASRRSRSPTCWPRTCTAATPRTWSQMDVVAAGSIAQGAGVDRITHRWRMCRTRCIPPHLRRWWRA